MKHQWVLRKDKDRTWDCGRCGMTRTRRISIRDVVRYWVGKTEVKRAGECVPQEVKP